MATVFSPSSRASLDADLGAGPVSRNGVPHWRQWGERLAGPTVTLCCLFIGLVSAYDAYLTMAYAPFLVSLEENPMGRAIMRLDEGEFLQMERIAYFLGLKFAGTVMAISLIHLIYYFRSRWALLAALGVSLAQAALLCYLRG